MPGMEHQVGAGIPGLQAIALAFPQVPILVVSGHFNASIIAAAMRNGARGFVPKTTAGKDLVGALRRVLQGELYVPHFSAAELLAQRQDLVPEGEGNHHPLRRVSPREATVLRLLIQGKTNKEIALHLGLKEITVKVHLQHAYRKIGAANRADAVRIVLRGENGEGVREAG
jgi:DNA-binding NarL/FixJ family response regulator